jgi:hypothetical protein
MNMTTLFDAEDARDEAIARVQANAPESWLLRARNTVALVSLSRFDFTTDDVWEVMGDDRPFEPRALGAVMKGMAREGKIRATGEYRKSDRVDCHARPVAVWRVCL